MAKVREMPREEIYRIAYKYATTKTKCAGDYFWDEEGLTKSQVRTILKKAIVESIVSDRIVQAIGYKAGQNAYEHAGDPGRIQSQNYQDRLLILRENYVLPKKMIKKLVKELATSGLSVNQFGARKYIFGTLMRRTVGQAVIKKLVSDKVVDALRELEKKYRDSFEVDAYYDQLVALRNQGEDPDEIPEIDNPAPGDEAPTPTPAPAPRTVPAAAPTPTPHPETPTPEDFQGVQLRII